MEKNEHKFPTLLGRLIHISSVELSRPNQTHTIKTVTEVIKVVQQYLGEVDEEGSKEITEKQRLLVEAGTLELLVRLMSWKELPRTLFLEILDLGCNILAVGGGYEEAQQRVHRFLCDSASQSFFLSMESQFRYSSEKMLALYSGQIETTKALHRRGSTRADSMIRHFEDKNYESKSGDHNENLSQEQKVAEDPGNCKLLRFWQWLCEGNYRPNQHLLRVQHHNARSINLLTLAVNFLGEIAELDLGQIENLRVAISLYELLCEAVQGACLENQRWLAIETELLETSNNILRQLNGLLALCFSTALVLELTLNT